MFIFQIWALVHFNQSFEPSNYFGKTFKTLLIVNLHSDNYVIHGQFSYVIILFNFN